MGQTVSDSGLLQTNDHGQTSSAPGADPDAATQEAVNNGIWLPGVSATEEHKPEEQRAVDGV